MPFPGAWEVYFSGLGSAVGVLLVGGVFLVPAALLGALARLAPGWFSEGLSLLATFAAVAFAVFFWSPGSSLMVYPHRPFLELLVASLALYPAIGAVSGRKRAERVLVLLLVWLGAAFSAWDNVSRLGWGRYGLLDATAVANLAGIPLLACLALWADQRAAVHQVNGRGHR